MARLGLAAAAVSVIRVEPVAEPEAWAADRARGEAWLLAHPAALRPRDYWSAHRDTLAVGFARRCAYTAVHIDLGGTVDHLVPWSQLRGTPEEPQAYAWSNLRYCSAWFNSRRKDRPVLDPYVVQDDWFELLLPSCQLVATDRVPAEHRELAADMLRRWLGHDEQLVRIRSEWLVRYREGDCALALVERCCPLVARALRAHPEFLRPDDRSAAAKGAVTGG